MYFAYIDASGVPIKKDMQNKYFVLSALIIHENQWQYIDNKINEIKIKHFPMLKPEDVELHAKDMLSRWGLFNGLSWEQIYSIFDDIFNFLTDDKTNVCIISTVISKEKMFYGKDIELWAYRLLVERLNKFLKKNNEKIILQGEPPQYGIMIIDSCSLKADSILRNKISGMLRDGTRYSDLDYLIEDPLFTDSKWRNLSQLVDCIAYAVQKHFKNSSKPSFHDENWEKYFQRMYKKFDKDEHNKIDGCGLKVFPSPNNDKKI